MPSCAGATSSSVSTYASSSSALSAGSGVVRRAASRVSSRWLSAVAAAYLVRVRVRVTVTVKLKGLG